MKNSVPMVVGGRDLLLEEGASSEAALLCMSSTQGLDNDC